MTIPMLYILSWPGGYQILDISKDNTVNIINEIHMASYSYKSLVNLCVDQKWIVILANVFVLCSSFIINRPTFNRKACTDNYSLWIIYNALALTWTYFFHLNSLIKALILTMQTLRIVLLLHSYILAVN